MGKKVTKKEINQHLAIALEEIGKIVPKYSKRFKCWYFEHPLYPVNYAGESKEEVIENYPKYLRVFIEERLKENLNPIVEENTKGRGGYRPGSGRPKGKEQKSRIYLPNDIARWLNQSPENQSKVRQLMCENGKR
jgi:hypothetical protein